MRWLAAVGVIAVVVIIAAGIYFFGGFYNVSAAVDDPDLMNWTLVHIREASINRLEKHCLRSSPISPRPIFTIADI